MKTTAKIIVFLFSLSSFYFFCHVVMAAKAANINKTWVLTLAMLFLFYAPYTLKK